MCILYFGHALINFQEWLFDTLWYICQEFNPFPNTFRDRPKLKQAADDNLNLAIKGF